MHLLFINPLRMEKSDSTFVSNALKFPKEHSFFFSGKFAGFSRLFW